MSILTFSHPRLRDIKFKFGQMNQVVGDNNETKQQLWQILSWYLSKHKYSEAELALLDYKEPEIWLDQDLLSRNTFETIIIESMTDLHDLLTVKKGTPVYSVLQEVTRNIEITENIEVINQQLEIIENKLNNSEVFKNINSASSVLWQTSISSLTTAELLQKQVTMEVIHNDNKSAIEYENGLEKYKALVSFLKNKLMNDPKPILLMIKNIDDILYYEDFLHIMKQFEKLINEFPYFHCMIFPSQIGYVHISEIYLSNILIVGEQTHMLEEGTILYESICNHYPDNKVPTYKVFLKHLQIIIPYLFSQIPQVKFLPIKDQVLIKIINELYYFYDFKPNVIETHTKLEYDFLFKDNRD